MARFFYQTSACNGAAPSLASVPGITGARYLAGAPIPEGDYALVLLNGNVPAGTTFLGWTVAGVNIGNAALGIHHPAGSWKRISFGTRTNDQTANIGSEAAPANLYYRVSWTQGKTEGGSSGSPLLNDLGQILGTLTSGPVVPPGLTVCEINPEIAGYGRFANAYPAIRAYLEDTPPPSLTVTPSSLAFTVNNGQYTGSSQQTLTIRTQSSTALPYSLKASAPWIRLSSVSGNVSASAPASVSVSLDLSYFSASTSTTGTVSVSSGTLTPISVSVQANVTITRSKVLATITPNPVYQQAANSDGYASFYTLRLAETGGVATRLTSFKYEGTDISNNIVGWFGSDLLPARGTLSSALRSRTQPVPVTRLFDVAGVDIATGLPWSVQVTVSILARPTKAILVLDSYPNLIRQDPNSTACPWYQQLVLQETGGFGVTLNRFVAAGYDLSGQIAGFWGDTRLSASGSLLGRLCWPAVQAPTTLDMEVGGIDSNGSTVSASVRASFSGPAAYPTTMSASPVSVARNLLVGSTSPVTSTISLSIGSNTATWTGRLVFRDAPNTWLTVWPLSGTGSVTLNLSALPAGLASGTHEATLLLQSTDAIPQLLSIPVRLSITQASPSLASVLGSASFQPGISSGSWFSVFGTNLAQTTRLWQVSDFAGNRLPTQLDGVSVFVNGKPAPVYYISPTQVNALAPDDSALGPVSVEVVTSQGRSTSMSADKRMFAPAWFMFDAEGRKYLAGVHPDGAYLGKPGLYSGLNLRPAKPGDIVMLYGTGFGPVNPATSSDQLVTQPGRLTSSVVVRIGGAVAVVPWAGLVSPGLYQFNVVVPNLLDGDQAVSAEIGGASSQTGAFITVRR